MVVLAALGWDKSLAGAVGRRDFFGTTSYAFNIFCACLMDAPELGGIETSIVRSRRRRRLWSSEAPWCRGMRYTYILARLSIEAEPLALLKKSTSTWTLLTEMASRCRQDVLSEAPLCGGDGGGRSSSILKDDSFFMLFNRSTDCAAEPCCHYQVVGSDFDRYS